MRLQRDAAKRRAPEACRWMKKMKASLVILFAVLIAGCDSTESMISDLTAEAQSITFTSGTTASLTNSVIHDSATIGRIVNNLNIGKSTSYSKHPFAHQMTITKIDGSTVRLEFEKEVWGQYCSIRTIDKQFVLSEKSFDLLMKEGKIIQHAPPEGRGEAPRP